ncbi:MAG: type II secretion system ATPase GspE [Opitutaceae bacterium]|nr:type II secretion system ATPase GspE [Opitutaceae bacterium]
MFASNSQAVCAVLGSGERAIAAALLQEALDEYVTTGKAVAEVAVDRGWLTRRELLDRVAQALDWPRAEIAERQIGPELAAALSPEIARNYGVAPWSMTSQRIELLAVDPFNHQIVDDLAFALGREVRLVVADPDEVAAVIRKIYGEDDARLGDVLAGIETEQFSDSENLGATDLAAMAGQAPIIRFVNLVLAQAIRDQASDIHFEPFEHDYRIRYRIDGALYDMAPPPRQLALPIASRIKVLANLDIAERRVAQDGRIKIMLSGRTVDLRVSTLPTQFGESVVLRVLDQDAVRLDLAQLGLPSDIAADIAEVIRRPNGIFIVTGPTGSGKTTTLYSGLRAINTPEVKILTAEDPVEYEIEGVMQVPVRAAIGLTFAAALRSFLRQDPDVIMVGEIRDLETAQVAIQASLTGHLVLSTLHTNDAPGAVTRLLDMGVEPFLIASSLEAVLAQRLVRRICRHCKQAYQPDASWLDQVGVDRRAVAGRPFYRGAGCAHCHQSGYQGRLGIFEWLRPGESIRELIMQRAPGLSLRQAAIRQGMRTLREDGLRAVLDGETTIEEILKYT